MNDGKRLREEFSQPEIDDGWLIISEGDGSGAYGYGSRDLLMYLVGPDGSIYCQESSCCSCNGIEGSFEPVLTSEETIMKDIDSYTNRIPDAEKARVAQAALDYVRSQ